MKIVLNSTPDFLEMRLDGRFDASWAEYVSDAIEDAVRGGSHRIALDFSSVTYISSMGIEIVLKHRDRLAAVQGQLVIVRPSEETIEIVRASGLAGPWTATVAAPVSCRKAEHQGATYEIYTQAAGATFECELVGDPTKFATGSFSEADCRAIDLPAGTVAVGLGAFGDNFADCRDRFGEFLAVGGSAVTLPTGGPGVPDSMLTRGDLVPRINALYAIVATGRFPVMLRFDDVAEQAGLIKLSQLVESALHLTNSESACFAILGEAQDVIGATLRRSPVDGSSSSPLEFPAVRDWISFTTERTPDRYAVLIAGVATRNPSSDAAAFLRPMTARSSVLGHFHAVVLPYRPVQRGELVLDSTVASLLSASTLLTVRHLMADARPIDSVGETELIRGACWVGPITRAFNRKTRQ